MLFECSYLFYFFQRKKKWKPASTFLWQKMERNEHSNSILILVFAILFHFFHFSCLLKLSNKITFHMIKKENRMLTLRVSSTEIAFCHGRPRESFNTSLVQGSSWVPTRKNGPCILKWCQVAHGNHRTPLNHPSLNGRRTNEERSFRLFGVPFPQQIDRQDTEGAYSSVSL